MRAEVSRFGKLAFFCPPYPIFDSDFWTVKTGGVTVDYHPGNAPAAFLAPARGLRPRSRYSMRPFPSFPITSVPAFALNSFR
jgi:hypothetical protein